MGTFYKTINLKPICPSAVSATIVEPPTAALLVANYVIKKLHQTDVLFIQFQFGLNLHRAGHSDTTEPSSVGFSSSASLIPKLNSASLVAEQC